MSEIKVEWVGWLHLESAQSASWEVPVVRVESLRQWIEQQGDTCITMESLLAMLPKEEGK